MFILRHFTINFPSKQRADQTLTYTQTYLHTLFHFRILVWLHLLSSLAGNFVLLWRRGTNVLTASNIMVTRDERVRLIDGYNLEISDLEPQDAGDYVCQISDKINRDQVHTVEILGEYNRPSVDRFCLRVKWTELASTSNLYEYFTYSLFLSLSHLQCLPVCVPYPLPVSCRLARADPLRWSVRDLVIRCHRFTGPKRFVLLYLCKHKLISF